MPTLQAISARLEVWMKYFPYELISAANGWHGETRKEQQLATRQCEREVIAYKRHLDRTRPNVSTAAWNFFRHGSPKNTLHDSRLVCMAICDVSVSKQGWVAGHRRRPVAHAHFEFLTYAEDRIY